MLLSVLLINKTIKMKKSLKKSIENAISYLAYRNLVANLLTEKKSTGLHQSEDIYKYSVLNDKRMTRLDKTIKLTDKAKETLRNYTQKQTWIVITEGWCGDAAQNLPVIHKMATFSQNINLKIVLRDENLELMDAFLTNGSRSIPKLIALDENNEILFTWGPRPSIATKLITDYKAKHGKVDDVIKQELQVWYNKNKGVNLQQDVIALLKR